MLVSTEIPEDHKPRNSILYQVCGVNFLIVLIVLMLLRGHVFKSQP